MSETTPKRWCFVGGGQMARALSGGMMSAGVISPEQVSVVEPNATGQRWWAEQQPKVQVEQLSDALKESQHVILAVKPHVLPSVLRDAKGQLDGKLVVSIAAGVPLETLISMVGHQRVVRVMPNTPALVGAGASAFCSAGEVTDADRQSIQNALASIGLAVEVSEDQMDAVTGLSGSGPAYVYLFIEALADGGVAAGLPRDLAMQLATQTVTGSAAMVRQTEQHPGALKDAVASPGGTTIAGIASLEQNGFRSAVIQAVQSAADRSSQLRRS